MVANDEKRRRAYLRPPVAFMVSGAVLLLVIASLILLQSFGVPPFGDDEPAVRDALEEDWGDRAEDDVTLPEEQPGAFRPGDPLEVAGIVVADGAYRLRIRDLVASASLPTDDATMIEFTSPEVEVYEGQLLPAEGDEALDTDWVAVEEAGVTEP